MGIGKLEIRPNPQSPTPNPQSQIPNKILIKKNLFKIFRILKKKNNI